MKVEIVGIITGAVLSIVTTFIFDKCRAKKEAIHNAKLLYYDILSIIKYFSNVDDGGRIGEYPDIRYNEQWQNIVANISFLESEQIGLLYNLYDAVYDYNKVFNETVDIVKYAEYRSRIQEVINNSELISLMELIKKKTKIK